MKTLRSLSICVAAGLALTAPLAPARADVGGSLAITISGIKSAKGVIRVALCPPDAGFPDCKNKVVRSASLNIANGQASVQFSGLAAGRYAVSVFHDANSNGKLDTFTGIPREGYGFSRNPPFRPRAPKFAEAELAVQGDTQTTIKLRYLL